MNMAVVNKICVTLIYVCNGNLLSYIYIGICRMSADETTHNEQKAIKGTKNY